MLILTRKKGETICIGHDVTVTILDIKGGAQIRIGIQAPKEVSIDRAEIRARKDAEKAS